MKWSMKIGTFAGIGVYVHATFLMLIAWVAFINWQEERSAQAALVGVLFILTLFACVVLHEFGHALTAARFGIRTRDITLLPIGGLARLERMPDDPRQELLVALAGPAVNVVIAAVLYVALLGTGGLTTMTPATLEGGSFGVRVMFVNVMLVLFNLLPAFPMDGGRVLRAVLAMRTDYVRATQIAASVGQGMALIFGLVGLFFNPFLMFIALFVWIGATQEAAITQMRSALGGIPVERAMITHFHALGPDDALSRAVELLLAGSQQDFPVVDNGQVVGVLTRQTLLQAIARHAPDRPVGDVMDRRVEAADASEMLEVAFRRLQGCDCHTMPVLRHGTLVGLITMENVGEFVNVQSALRGFGTAALPPRDAT
jgi:Zn-dependent protease/predicted transcriptional regulator